jgi:hypothetical protein
VTPKIGVPRVIAGPTIPVLYPGETASAQYTLTPEFLAAMEPGRPVELPVTDWIIEPISGWRGVWLRWRYRLVGRWFPRRGQPALEGSATVTHDRIERTLDH